MNNIRTAEHVPKGWLVFLAHSVTSGPLTDLAHSGINPLLDLAQGDTWPTVMLGSMTWPTVTSGLTWPTPCQ